MAHLILLLIKIFLRLAFPKENRTKAKHVTKAKYVMECPTCNELRMSSQRDVVSVDASMVLRTQCEGRLIVCDTCRNAFNFESFAADSDGVYRLKMWDCPKCGQLSPSTSFMCFSCGYKLA
jgi:hypothetical protein